MFDILEDRDGLSMGHTLQDLPIDRKNFIPWIRNKIRFILRLNILAESLIQIAAGLTISSKNGFFLSKYNNKFWLG